MSIVIKNCWEINLCGREPGGAGIAEHGVCPVTVETKYDGVNGGKNAGRLCWVVAGSFKPGPGGMECRLKQISCLFCDFFKQVEEEEGRNFVLSPNSF